MFKRLSLLLTLLLPTAGAFAFMDLSAFGGYTTLAMGDVNNTLNYAKTAYGGSVTPINNGFYVGAEGGFTLIPELLKIGPRVEYVQGGQGAFSFNPYGNGNISGTFSSDDLLLEVGLSTGIELPLSGLWLKGGLYGGYGLAASSEYINNGQYGTETDYGSGGGFAGEANVQLNYKMALGFSLGLDLGYRYAVVSNMNVNSEAGPGMATNQLPAVGSPVVNKINADGTQGGAANFDFSGVNIGADLTWSF